MASRIGEQGTTIPKVTRNNFIARRHFVLWWATRLAHTSSGHSGRAEIVHEQPRTLEAAERQWSLRRASKIGTHPSAGQEIIEE